MKIKTISSFLLFGILSLSVFCQTDIDIEEVEPTSEKKSERNTNMTYFYSIQQWQGLPELLVTKNGRNHESGILIIHDLLDINHLMNIGLGWSFKISHLHSNVNDWSDANLSAAFEPSYFHSSFDYKKNKMVTGWLGIPLCLSIKTSRDYKKAFVLQGGVNASYLLFSHTKLVYEITKIKVKAGEYINPYRLDAICTFGWRFVHLYTSLELNPFLKSSDASSVRNWTSGIAINIKL